MTVVFDWLGGMAVWVELSSLPITLRKFFFRKASRISATASGTWRVPAGLAGRLGLPCQGGWPGDSPGACRSGLFPAGLRYNLIGQPIGSRSHLVQTRRSGFPICQGSRYSSAAVQVSCTAQVLIAPCRITAAGTGQIFCIVDHDLGHAGLTRILLEQGKETTGCQGQVDGSVERYGGAGSDASPFPLPGLHGWSPFSAARPIRVMPARFKSSRTSATWP